MKIFRNFSKKVYIKIKYLLSEFVYFFKVCDKRNVVPTKCNTIYHVQSKDIICLMSTNIVLKIKFGGGG